MKNVNRAKIFALRRDQRESSQEGLQFAPAIVIVSGKAIGDCRPMKEPVNKSEIVMAIATVAMTAATVVMMWSGCQQTRIADATERLNRRQEEIRLLAAKREIRKAWSDVNGILFREQHPKTKEECISVARKIHDRMESVPDNYFLLNHPAQAKAWDKLVGTFGIYLAPDFLQQRLKTVTEKGAGPEHNWTDNEMTNLFNAHWEWALKDFSDFYEKLGVTEFELVPTNSLPKE